MAGELLDVGHELCLLACGGSAAYTLSEANGLTSNLALEWAEDQLFRLGGVKDVEAGPVYGGGWGGERVVCVPEERGYVGGVTGASSVSSCPNSARAK